LFPFTQHKKSISIPIEQLFSRGEQSFCLAFAFEKFLFWKNIFKFPHFKVHFKVHFILCAFLQEKAHNLLSTIFNLGICLSKFC
jgi:hypothetical protein